MATSKREAQKVQTRKHLLENAFELFAENGLAMTRTIDLANKANVSHGTVFVHFPTREDLLNNVIREFGNRITKRIHQLASGGSGLKEMLEAHLQGLTEFESFYSRLITESSLLPISANHTLIGIQSAISFHIQSAAEHEIKTGKIKDIPLHFLFNTWIGLIHYYLSNRNLFAPGESVLRRYGPTFVEHYLNLLQK